MIDWKNGTKVWCVFTQKWSRMLLCDSKDDALDQMTRNDILVSFVISEFTEETVDE